MPPLRSYCLATFRIAGLCTELSLDGSYLEVAGIPGPPRDGNAEKASTLTSSFENCDARQTRTFIITSTWWQHCSPPSCAYTCLRYAGLR